MSTDLRTSLQKYTLIQTFAANSYITRNITFTDGTKSNFMIGIPLADSEIFQGGITTPAQVQIQLVAQRLAIGVNAKHANVP